MKSPAFRLVLDPRREWECPRCGRRALADGDVTVLRCVCDGETCMVLEERLRRTDSPFDHAGLAARKRIEAAIGTVPEHGSGS